MAEIDDIRKTNVTLSRRDVRAFKRLMLNWEEENDFPIDLKESHCLNAAVQLIIRSSSPELIDELAKERNMSEEDRKHLHDVHGWFMKEYIEMLRNLINNRIDSDKRRMPRQEV